MISSYGSIDLASRARRRRADWHSLWRRLCSSRINVKQEPEIGWRRRRSLGQAGAGAAIHRAVLRRCAPRSGGGEAGLRLKTFPAEAILPALRSGQRIFGENRVQEAAAKWPALRAEFPDIELHLIGPLQSNKVEMAVDVFDRIESYRSPEDRPGRFGISRRKTRQSPVSSRSIPARKARRRAFQSRICPPSLTPAVTISG